MELNAKTLSITMKSKAKISALLVLIATASGASSHPDADMAKQHDEEAAKASVPYVTSLDFEKFRDSVYKEPFQDGGYVVNGDIFIPNDTFLLEFYVRGLVAEHQSKKRGAKPFFTIDVLGGYENVWDTNQKTSLTYCVSQAFGSEYQRVVEAMESATIPWEQSAAINFIHLSSEDSKCDQRNSNVVFDVRPVSVNGEYLARAFFPNYARAQRNVMIDKTAMKYANDGPGLTLTGILRHELGHTIGARHEHTRPESGACFEDSSWVPVTDYDAFSVMHYPQCNGLGDWTLKLTNLDKQGVACTYGAAAGFAIDPSLCAPRNYRSFEIFTAG